MPVEEVAEDRQVMVRVVARFVSEPVVPRDSRLSYNGALTL